MRITENSILFLRIKNSFNKLNPINFLKIYAYHTMSDSPWIPDDFFILRYFSRYFINIFFGTSNFHILNLIW